MSIWNETKKVLTLSVPPSSGSEVTSVEEERISVTFEVHSFLDSTADIT
jgi:hypothetical protein